MNPSEYNRTVKNEVRFVKVPFDRETMWVDINHKLRREKRRRNILFFFCFLSLGMMGSYILIENFQTFDASDTALKNAGITQIKGEKGDKIKTFGNIKMEENVLDIRLEKSQKTKPSSTVSKTFDSKKSIESAQVEREKMNDPFSEDQPETKVQMAKTDRIGVKPLFFKPKTLLRNIEKPTMQKPVSLPLIRDNKGQKSILIYSGMGMAKRTLKSLDFANEFSELLQIKENSEKVLEQISFGMDFTHVLKSNILFTIGAEYRHITEKVFFDYKVRETFGDFSSFQTSKVTSYQYHYYNNYRFIDIRSGFGYMVNTKKVNVSFAAGISYSLYQSFDGVLLSEEERPKETFTTSFTKNLFHFTGSASFDYKLNDQWSILLAPSGSFGLNYFSIGDQPIGQKYDILNIRLGLKKLL